MECTMFMLLVALPALLQNALSHRTDPSVYMVTMTSQTIGGETATFCIHIVQPKEVLSVAVSLRIHNLGDSTLLKETVKNEFYRCVPFQVPYVIRDHKSSLRLSIVGKTENYQDVADFVIKPASFLTIIQTDKPVYKPGQTILFRLVSLTTDFLRKNQTYRTVELQDSKGNRIAQWLNQSTISGIVDLSHPMSSEAIEGDYVINVWDERNRKAHRTFVIKEYVLPKYEVILHLPDYISIIDPVADIKVCGKYTYGKAVQGTITLNVCLTNQWNNICMNVEDRAGKDGCFMKAVNISEISRNVLKANVYVYAEMKEDGTDVLIKSKGIVSITGLKPISAQFLAALTMYRPGLPYVAKVKVTGPGSTPQPNRSVNLTVRHRTDSPSEQWTLRTNSKGLADISLNTSTWKRQIFLEAKVLPEVTDEDKKGTQPFYKISLLRLSEDRTNNFVKIVKDIKLLPCNKKGTVRAAYFIQSDYLQGGQKLLVFYYNVLSRGSIVSHGHVEVAAGNGEAQTGELSFPLEQTVDLAPLIQVLVYTYMPRGGQVVVADSAEIQVQMCLKNKVTLHFSSARELPAGKTSLEIKAHPGSICSLRAVDKSVILMKPEDELSVESVYSLLPLSKLPPARLENSDELCDASDEAFADIFLKVGLKILFKSQKPKATCTRDIVFLKSSRVILTPDMKQRLKLPIPALQRPSNKEVVENPVSIRTFFPETWIWELVPVGASGSATLEQTVPDTITEWAAGALCTSPAGFGLVAGASLTAFQPFFVSLTLPYSVKRGEVFPLKATVFNYLPECIMVEARLAESEHFTVKPCDGCQYQECVCSQESKTFSWTFTPAALGELNISVSAEAIATDQLCDNEVATVPKKGRIDTVVQTLLVEPEGVRKSVSHNRMLLPSDGPAEEKFSLQVPPDVVEGSVWASVVVAGDIMATSMKNVDNLLAMPYGCGEQNMIRFTPNIYILRYLESTSQLTEEIRTKATHFLQSGYQRELTYKHNDGSYSAFGQSDNSGSTWLTAFVLKSFGGARPYIYVDPAHITSAMRWLTKHNTQNGCVIPVGRIIDKSMQGGVNDRVTLTAYVAASVLELDQNLPASSAVLSEALSCLKSATENLTNLYAAALLAYTFTLAGNQEIRSRLMSHLDKQAKTADGLLYWQSSVASGKLDVEMTSYVLLAVVTRPYLPAFDMTYASKIARWLIQQQNPYGGFDSTQDTVVALQALAQFSTATFSSGGDTTVTVTSSGTFSRRFTVNTHNRLLHQEERLTEVPGEYTVTAEGQSSVVVKLSAHYNIPPPLNYTSFFISTDVEGQCGGPQSSSIRLTMTVRYSGQRAETNMVIIDVNLLSGYLVNQNSLTKMKTDRNVKRIDTEKGHVVIYLDGLNKNEPQNLSLVTEEDIRVTNLHPGIVKVYDYYQPSDAAVSEYRSPCHTATVNMPFPPQTENERLQVKK